MPNTNRCTSPVTVLPELGARDADVAHIRQPHQGPTLPARSEVPARHPTRAAGPGRHRVPLRNHCSRSRPDEPTGNRRKRPCMNSPRNHSTHCIVGRRPYWFAQSHHDKIAKVLARRLSGIYHNATCSLEPRINQSSENCKRGDILITAGGKQPFWGYYRVNIISVKRLS